MKKILTFALLVISFSAFSQTSKPRSLKNDLMRSSDTLTIRDTSIHFIKIGGDVYEVKRRVELIKVESNSLHIGGYFPNNGMPLFYTKPE